MVAIYDDSLVQQKRVDCFPLEIWVERIRRSMFCFEMNPDSLCGVGQASFFSERVGAHRVSNL